MGIIARNTSLNVWRTALLVLVMLTSPWSSIAQPVFKQSASIPWLGHFILNDSQIIQTGIYMSPVDFDQDGIPDITNRGGSDIYIMSYDEQGTLNWIQTAGGNKPSEDSPFGPTRTDEATAIASDNEGNVYVAGTFAEAADFDYDGFSDVQANQPDTVGTFVAKYNADGVFQFVTQFDNYRGRVSKMLYSESRQSIFLLSTTSFTFRPDWTVDVNVYLIEMDLQGGVIEERAWVFTEEGGEGYFIASDMALGIEGNLYLTGRYKGTVDFDKEGPIEPLTSNPYAAAHSTFTAKYNPAGELQWVRSSYDTWYSSPTDLVVDSDENVYVMGRLTRGDTSFFGEGLTFTGTAYRDNIFVVKYSSEGVLQWAWFPVDLDDNVFLSLRSSFYAWDLILDSNEAPLLVGSIRGLVDMDGDGEADLDTEEYEPFMTRLSSDGKHTWSWNYEAFGQFFMIEKDSGNQFYLLSQFVDSVDYDGLGGIPPISPFDTTKVGVAISKFELLDPPLPVELTSFTGVVDGDEAVLSWATASETNNAGFEVLHRPEHSDEPALDIPFISGTGTINELQSYTHVVKNLTPGTHHFQLKQIDFDGTFTLSDEVTLVVDLDAAYQLTRAYPNPFNPRSTFSLSVAQDQEVEVVLYNVLGQRVQSIFKGLMEANTVHEFVIDGSGLPSGTYLYQVTGRQFQISKPVTLLK